MVSALKGVIHGGQPQGARPGSNLTATNTARMSVLEIDQYAGHLIALVLSFAAKGCAVPTQTLLRLPKAEQEEGGVFGPNEIAVMTTAFDQILLDLKLMDRNDPMATIIAKLVINLVRNGERDLEKLRKQVFEAYQPFLYRAPRGASAAPGHPLANRSGGWNDLRTTLAKT